VRKRVVGLVAVFAILSMVASACGNDKGGSNKKELKIAIMGALTGDYAQLFVHAANGAELAIQQMNAMNDLPVKLVALREDTQGSKDKATPIANQLKDDATLVALVGPGFSGESFAVNPIFGQAGVPEVTPSATNPGLNAIANVSGKTWFRAVGNDNSQGGPAPDLIFKYLKGKEVFIGHDKSAYGQGLAQIVRDLVDRAYAGKRKGYVGVDPGKKDYSALVSQVVSSKADVFYWGGYSPEGALILKQLRERGSKVQFVGADGSKDETFLKAGASAEGAVLTCPCSDPTVATDDASKKFVSDYKAKFGVDPGVYGAEGYDTINIIAAAIKKAGEPGSDIVAYRAKVAANIKSTASFKGLTKTYAFQENGELISDAVKIYLYKVVAGKFVLQGEAEDLAGA
jgi:branched-chain amino acid transport system substrate-binding protein